MHPITFITPDFAVTSALGLEDFAAVARLGFRTVIGNRPDGEEAGQPSSAECAACADRHGVDYRYVPATSLDLFTDPVVAAMAQALAESEGPTLAYCKSGQRSAIVWAAASARRLPVAEVMNALKGAGFDLAFLRDELDSQADRLRWMAPERRDDEAVSTTADARAAA